MSNAHALQTPLAAAAAAIAAVEHRPDPAAEAIAEINLLATARVEGYRRLVLQVSAGEIVDARRLLAAAVTVGRSPHRLQSDLETARAAYLAWQESVPVV